MATQKACNVRPLLRNSSEQISLTLTAMATASGIYTSQVRFLTTIVTVTPNLRF